MEDITANLGRFFGKKLNHSIAIDEYIVKTRRWINNLTLDMDTLNYSKLINDKVIKHQQKLLNQSE